MIISSLLIVEDEPFILDMYEEVLRRQMLRVTGVRNGEEAYHLLAEGATFDVILLDIMLPKTSGVELLEMIKDNGRIILPPVILITNLPDKTVIDRCFALGAIGTITKSEITPGQLLPIVQKILDKKEATS